MRSRALETTFLAALVQMAATLLLLVVCSPALRVAIYGVVRSTPVWDWAVLVMRVV